MRSNFFSKAQPYGASSVFTRRLFTRKTTWHEQLVNVSKAAVLALGGALAVLVGLAILPLTMLLMWLRQKTQERIKVVVSLHEALGCLLWVGVSWWVCAGAELRR